MQLFLYILYMDDVKTLTNVIKSSKLLIWSRKSFLKKLFVSYITYLPSIAQYSIIWLCFVQLKEV